MEKTKKLYPLRFTPLEISHGWGKERIAIADLGIEDSVVKEGWLADNSIGDIMDTYMERVSGDGVYGYYGRQFPLLVKFLEIEGELPVHVHADNTIAGQRYDVLGGKEFWYVMNAEDDARIYLGFNKDVSAAELYTRCSDGTVKEILNEIRPEKGDCFTVNPGIVHSAGYGLTIAVIKEASELPFILYGKGEDGKPIQETHIADAMDFIDYGRYILPPQTTGWHDRKSVPAKLADCPEFMISGIGLEEPLHITAGEAGTFMLYICTRGKASVQCRTSGDGQEKTSGYTIQEGEAILIPAEVQDYFLVPMEKDTEILEAGAGEPDDTDDYIDPDTEPFLEGEDYEGLEDEESGEEKENGSRTAGHHDMKWN